MFNKYKFYSSNQKILNFLFFGPILLSIPFFNNLMFTFAFTLIRVIGFPWMILIHLKHLDHYDLWNKGTYKDMKDDIRSKHVTTKHHQIAYCTLLIFFIMVYLLNLFWFTFIVKGFMRLIGGDPGYDGTDGKKKTKVDDKTTKTE